MSVKVPAEPEPIEVDPDRAAVIVVDMQNTYCSEGGLFDRLGFRDEEMMRRVIDTAEPVIERAREAGVKVVYLRMTYREDLSNAGGQDSPNYWRETVLTAMREHPEWEGIFATEGTWGWEIVDDLKPREGDIVVNKNRPSGFSNTELDVVLRTHEIKHLFFVGVATNICVESTLRDAYSNEYFPVLVRDACGNTGPGYTQKATVWNVSTLFGWVTGSEDLLEALDDFE